MGVNYEYYKIFYYAAKYKNITRAAAALGSSQPNITRMIKLLEAESGSRLFVREARGITLTEAGERLFAHIKDAVIQLEHAQEEMSLQNTDDMGTVEIGATETALHLFLLDALRSFREEYPGVRIKIHNHTTPEILKNLASGRLDFAVLTTPFELQGAFASSNLVSFREILAGGSQYRELKDKKRRLKELGSYPWVGLGEGTATYDYYNQFFAKQQADLRLDVEVATSDLLIPLIQDNFGIGFVPQDLALPLLRTKALVQIPLHGRLPEREICLVCDKGRGCSVVSKKLQNYLLKFAPMG